MYGPVLLEIRGWNSWQIRNQHGHESHRFPLCPRHFSPTVINSTGLGFRPVFWTLAERLHGEDLGPETPRRGARNEPLRCHKREVARSCGGHSADHWSEHPQNLSSWLPDRRRKMRARTSRHNSTRCYRKEPRSEIEGTSTIAGCDDLSDCPTACGI